MTDLIVLIILAALVGGALSYIVKAKKNGANVSAARQAEAAPAVGKYRERSWKAA